MSVILLVELVDQEGALKQETPQELGQERLERQDKVIRVETVELIQQVQVQNTMQVAGEGQQQQVLMLLILIQPQLLEGLDNTLRLGQALILLMRVVVVVIAIIKVSLLLVLFLPVELVVVVLVIFKGMAVVLLGLLIPGAGAGAVLMATVVRE
jgi:hypothetical protein